MILKLINSLQNGKLFYTKKYLYNKTNYEFWDSRNKYSSNI